MVNFQIIEKHWWANQNIKSIAMETENYFHYIVFFLHFFRISLKLSLNKTHRLMVLSKIYMLDKSTLVAMVTIFKKKKKTKVIFSRKNAFLKII